MACLELPEFPALPDISPFSLTAPTLQLPSLSVEFCCRLDLIPPTPPLVLGAVVLAIPGASAVILGINQMTTLVNAYLKAIPLDCPRE